MIFVPQKKKEHDFLLNIFSLTLNKYVHLFVLLYDLDDKKITYYQKYSNRNLTKNMISVPKKKT